MEAVFPIVILIAVVYGIMRCMRFLSFQRKCKKAFVHVGKRYNGNSPSGGVTFSFFFSKPTLSFPYRDTYCQVRLRRTKAFLEYPQATELRIRVIESLPDLEVTTGMFKLNHFEAASQSRVPLEDAHFRQRFRIGSMDVEAARELFSKSVLWQLEQLRQLGGTDEVAIVVRRDVMYVKKPTWISNPQLLDDFVRFALQLYDQLLLTKARGIDFVNDESASVIDDVKCPICSEEIVEDMVVCTRCKTPHCKDCWHYNGECATFACGEKRFLQVG